MVKKLIFLLFLTLCTSLFSNRIYWDRENLIASGQIGKIKTVSDNNRLYIFYSDMGRYKETNGYFSIKCLVSSDGRAFREINLSLPNAYSSTEFGFDFDAVVYKGRIFVFYREDPRTLSIWEIDTLNQGKKLIYRIDNNGKIMYLPKITTNGDNGFFIIYYSYDTTEVLNFEAVTFQGTAQNKRVLGQNLQSVLNPEIVNENGKVYITYQARESASGEGRQLFYKLFLEYSTDNLENWTIQSLTHGDEELRQNQRPHFAVENDILYMVWEKDDENFLPHINYKIVKIAANEIIFNKMLSSSGSEAYYPRILRENGLNNIFWYDNASGSFQNYYVQAFNDQISDIEALRQIPARTVLINPVIYRSSPLLVWNNLRGNINRLYIQKNDEFVESPALFVRGVQQNGITSNTTVTLYWRPVDDPSGIKEYRLLLTQDRNERINVSRVGLSPFITERTFTDLSDGKWYAGLAAYDNAGNASEVRELAFEIDTVPPLPPFFSGIEKSEDGSLTTNSPVISWSSEGEDYSKYEVVSRYFYGEFDMEAAVRNAARYIETSAGIRSGTITQNQSISFNNLDNGVIVVGIAGYDPAGNRSEFIFESFILNNYIPVTYIDSANFVTHGIVDKVLRITGRGFAVDGNVTRLIIDRDRKEPYDYTVEGREVRVLSDRVVTQRTPFDIEDGSYYIGVEHPERGIVFFNRRVNYSTEWFFSFEKKDYFVFNRLRGFGKSVNATKAVMTIIACVWALMFLLLLRGIIITARERHYMSQMLLEFENARSKALDTAQTLQKEVIMKIRMSLTVKYTLLILSLVILVVSSTSTVVGIFALRNTSISLTEEIKKRFDITLTNYKAGIDDLIFFNKEEFESIDLTRTASRLPNIGIIFSKFGKNDYFAFAMGQDSDVSYNDMYLSEYANMDDNTRRKTVAEHVYTPELEEIISIYKDKKLPQLISESEFNADLQTRINAYKLRLEEQIRTSQRRADVLRLENSLSEAENFISILSNLYVYSRENRVYTLENSTDEETAKGLYDFLITIDWLYNRTYVIPAIDPGNLHESYAFYMPVYPIDFQTGRRYYAGDVVICYSFKDTIEMLENQRRTLIYIVVFVTLIAIAVSAVGSIILAASTIRPIKKMYNHVNVISKTDDYEELVGTENETLEIKTGDEIAILAKSINEMTHKLIEKAMADKQLLLGKEIQKKFIPLEPYETDDIDIYGFYEGAKGVSGDYFDFKKIDNEHYAFIICDVAGKAVPAALIMVQISTIFHSFTSNFKPGVDKIETTKIVTEINDTVAERGFQGRFAAILVLILNIKTGKAYMTNAGYTQMLVYRKSKNKCEWIQLDDKSGAAGVFPSYMLPYTYKQETMKLDHGDVLFLFSDGIEESRNGETYYTEAGELQYDEFGLKRIVETLDAAPKDSAKSIIDYLMTTEKKYRGNLEQYDDLTILAVKRK